MSVPGPARHPDNRRTAARRTTPEASEEQGESDRRIEAEAAGDRIAAGRRRSLVGGEEGEEAGDACRQADVRQGGLMHLLWAQGD
jgi:hypothetical protein